MRKIGIILILLTVFGCTKENSKNSNSQPKNQEIQWLIPDIEADEIDFGIVSENNNKLVTIHVVNKTESVIPGAPSILGDSSFKLAYTNCQDLAPQKNCIVKVVFSSVDNTLLNRSANIVFGPYTNLMFAGTELLTDGTVQFYTGTTPINSLNLGVLNYNQQILKTIKIVNRGNVTTNESVVLSGSSFNLSYDNCSNRPLLPTKSCMIKIYVSGRGLSGVINETVSYGEQELDLHIEVNNFETLRVDSDIKLFYQQQILGGILDVGTLNLNVGKILYLDYKNVGEYAGDISSITSSSNIFYNNCSAKILNPNQSCQIRLTLDTSNLGTFSQSLTAGINGGEELTQLFQYQVRQPGDKINCASQIDFADSAFITWTGVEYSGCIINECITGYHISDNQCDIDQFAMNVVTPLAGEISGPSIVDYGSSATFTYTAGEGYVFDSWSGDCLGLGVGNSCLLENITAEKTISVVLSCAEGWIPQDGLCIDNRWPRGALGDLVINSGETVSLTAGQSYDYNSVTVNAGGTLNISGKGILLLGSKGNVVINGSVTTNRWTDCGGTFSVNDSDGSTPVSKTYIQSAGGNGANGAPGANGPSGAGGTSSCGWGGGGGGGGAANNGTFFGGAGGSGQNNGAVGRNNVAGGLGGQATTLDGVNATSTAGSAGGRGQGGGGGGGAGGFVWGGGGGGGGGGGKGSHANSLIIKSKGTVSGTGSINLAGSNGTNGGQGGKGYATQSSSPLPAACGGGGGGGAGGSAGDFKIISRGNTSNSLNINLSGGTRGTGGAGNSNSRVFTSAAGANGVNGVNGTYSSTNW